MRKIFILFIVICNLWLNEKLFAQKEGDVRLEPYVFKANNGQQINAEFGWLLVPENRSKPKSRLIELAFIRFKSTAEKPGYPIVYLVGGPGNSAINQAKGANFQMYMALREVGDLILLDQRGTGLSKPDLECTERLDYPLEKPFIPSEMLVELKLKSRKCADRLRNAGVDLSGYNTNENADDVDALRKAIGAEKLNLFGTSYGTHLSLNLIKRHSANLNRVVLAGVEGPDHTYKLPKDIDNNLERIFALYKATPSLNREIPDFKALLLEIIDRLEKQPIIVSVTDPETKQKIDVPIGADDLRYLLAGYLPGRVSAIRNFPKIAYQMSKGDFSFIANTMLAARLTPIGSAMKFLMDCSSSGSKMRLKLIHQQSQKVMVGNFANFPFPDVCSEWKDATLDESFRSPAKSKVPILFISGTLDGRTPESNVEEIKKGFPNSFHLVIEGAGHVDSSMFIQETQQLMLRFLKGETLTENRIVAKPIEFSPLQ